MGRFKAAPVASIEGSFKTMSEVEAEGTFSVQRQP
jgi:hypothetical protein